MQINLNNSLFMSHRTNSYSKIINQSIQKLSTGKRINSAADSPSDMLRISRFSSEIRGSHMAQRNIQDGISFLQVTESALTQMQNIGHRLKELSVQYNSELLTTEDKALIENEGKELMKEMQHIIENTRFGKLKVFEKDSYTIQTGPYSGETYEIKLPDFTELKEIAVNGQKSAPPSNHDDDSGQIGHIDDDDNDIGNVGDVGNDDDNPNVGDIGNGDDNNGDVGGVGDGDDNDDNGDIGGIDDNDNNDDVGGISDNDDNNNGDVGNIDDGDNNDVGGLGSVGDDDQKDPSLNGYQKLFDKNGALIYDGYMKNGEFHGYGKLYSDEGTLIYDGYWNDGKYDHYGKLFYSDGKIKYDGYWDNNNRHGWGKSFYSDGKIQYEGNWSENKYHGLGKAFDENGSLIYEGEWVNGETRNITNTTQMIAMTAFSMALAPMEAEIHSLNTEALQPLSETSPTSFEDIHIADVLQNDFVDKHILNPIGFAISHNGVMENILEIRLESQIQNEELKQNALSRITDVDVAKELMTLIKNQMLMDTSMSLLHQDLAHQRSYISKLLG